MQIDNATMTPLVPVSSKRRRLLLSGTTVLLVACVVLVVSVGFRPSQHPGSSASAESQLLSSQQEFSAAESDIENRFLQDTSRFAYLAGKPVCTATTPLSKACQAVGKDQGVCKTLNFNDLADRKSVV